MRPMPIRPVARHWWPLPLIGAAALVTCAAVVRHQTRTAERTFPPQGRFMMVDGMRLHYRVHGPADVTQHLVLLHGNGTMGEDFELSGLVGEAAQRYRVSVFDRPRFGYSTRPADQPWRPQEQAELMHAALQQLGVHRPVVLGHSWGAAPPHDAGADRRDRRGRRPVGEHTLALVAAGRAAETGLAACGGRRRAHGASQRLAPGHGRLASSRGTGLGAAEAGRARRSRQSALASADCGMSSRQCDCGMSRWCAALPGQQRLRSIASRRARMRAFSSAVRVTLLSSNRALSISAGAWQPGRGAGDTPGRSCTPVTTPSWMVT